MNIELMIAKDAKGTFLFSPVLEEGITLSTERRGSPGKLTFKVYRDSILHLFEGAPVRLSVDGNKLFYGFIFSYKGDKGDLYEVTAYDQIKYLSKNKDTYVYENKTASQFIQMLAADFSLQIGTIEDTKYVIKSRTEDNTGLLDMIENALDLTLQNTKEMFVLYDDFGAITLKNIGSMKVGDSGKYFLLNANSGENYEYSSSIDENTYNKIKLIYDNQDTGKREVYIAQHGENINKWGILQFYEKLKEGENGQAKADALLSLYNKVTKKLSLKSVLGDIRVRAGSMVAVSLDIGGMKLSNFMLVEKCTHKFYANNHVMDLTLRGGDIRG